MMNVYSNDIDNFVFKFFYSQLKTALARHISENIGQFDLRKSSCAEAELTDMNFKYASNVKICDDTLNFDAVVSAAVCVKHPTRRDGLAEKTVKKRFRIHCRSVVEECVKDFAIYSIEPYVASKQKNESKRPTNKLIPIISRDELDTEATAFLERYCPEALETPMPVPIDSILRSQLGLEIIKNKRLSTDFSIFGQICFSSGKVEVYGVKDDTPHEITVKRGTILIDACAPFLRNIGCIKYTLAHEAYHWFRHRIYAAIKALLHGEPAIAYRCTAAAATMTSVTPQQELHWIEWQANKIAPRILMPQKTTLIKIEELMSKYGYCENEPERDIILECVINSLADFFRVSKQAAKIRMIDLGYDAAKRVYNYGKESTRHTRTISIDDAVQEYTSNPDFRVILDSGLFSYADEHFVINHERYVIKHGDGRRNLTEYAKANISQCTLCFTYRRVYVSNNSTNAANTGILCHANTAESKKSKYEHGEENIPVLLQVDELYKGHDDFSKFCTMRQVTLKPFSQLAFGFMQVQKWNSSIFARSTLLGEPLYSRIKSGHELKPDVRTVVAICAGLDLDIMLSSELLQSAGHVLTGSLEDQAYFYIIHNYRGKSIHARNKFLEEVGVPTLGAKSKKVV